MITVNNTSIIGRVIERNTCATITVTNYELCPVEFLEFVSRVSFVVNTVSKYPDLICVIPNEVLNAMVDKLARISSFVKVEEYREIQ